MSNHENGSALRLMRLLFVAFIIILSVALLGCQEDTPPREATVLVMLAHDEAVTVKSENPVRIKLGEDAVFEVELDKNYSLELGEGCILEDGWLTVSNVRVPTTVKLIAKRLSEYEYSFMSGISSSVAAGKYQEGTPIAVSAPEKKDGKLFIGYSNGAELKDGGRLVSYIREYSFKLGEVTRLYPNYATDGAELIIYNANGGTVSGGGEAMSVEWKNSVYTCPNALINKDYFYREGYVLAGYNTAPDGSGRYYGCGWNIVMPEGGVVQLYCQWMKQTDVSQFEYSIKSGSLTIIKYNGNDGVVVIPETIDGCPVNKIAAGAFSGKDMHTLFISRNVEVIVDKAFDDCKRLGTLYFSDGVLSVTDSAFSACPTLSTLYLQAVLEPRYISSRNGTYQIKYERLMTAQSPKLVLVAGSNVAYGIDSARLEQAIDHKYNVVNYGCNQSTPITFYMEIAAYWANEGDILVHAPEISDQFQYGKNEINTTHWQIFEGAYGAFSCVDIRNYSKLFTSFASFNAARRGRSPQNYELYTNQTVNSYGDYIQKKVGTNYKPSYGTRVYTPSVLRDDYVENLNAAIELCRARGMTVYLSFGVVNIESLKEDSKNSSTQAAYMDAMTQKLLYDARISDVATYAMESRYFYNSDYHLNTEGSHVRTDNFAADLLAQLAREGR